MFNIPKIKFKHRKTFKRIGREAMENTVREEKRKRNRRFYSFSFKNSSRRIKEVRKNQKHEKEKKKERKNERKRKLKKNELVNEKNEEREKKKQKDGEKNVLCCSREKSRRKER